MLRLKIGIADKGIIPPCRRTHFEDEGFHRFYLLTFEVDSPSSTAIDSKSKDRQLWS